MSEPYLFGDCIVCGEPVRNDDRGYIARPKGRHWLCWHPDCEDNEMRQTA